mgnify:CR=1 FL=1
MQVLSKKILSLVIIYLLNVIMLTSTYAVDNNTQDKSQKTIAIYCALSVV